MSYSQSFVLHPLGTHETDTNILTERIKRIWETRMSHWIDIQQIINAPTGEVWSTHIINALLQNLSFDGSVHGQFGTPDRDIKKVVGLTGNNKHIWVKLLGIKMRVLLSVMDTLPGISSTQKERIHAIDLHLRNIFPEKNINNSL